MSSVLIILIVEEGGRSVPDGHSDQVVPMDLDHTDRQV